MAIARAVDIAAHTVAVTLTLGDGVTTGGQIDYPTHGTPPFPAVLLIPGSGVADRDEAIAETDGTLSRPFAQIAEALTTHGLAVLRYDRRCGRWSSSGRG